MLFFKLNIYFGIKRETLGRLLGSKSYGALLCVCVCTHTRVHEHVHVYESLEITKWINVAEIHIHLFSASRFTLKFGKKIKLKLEAVTNRNEVKLWSPGLTQNCHIVLFGPLDTGEHGALLLVLLGCFVWGFWESVQYSLKYWATSVHLKDHLCLVAKGPEVNLWYL